MVPRINCGTEVIGVGQNARSVLCRCDSQSQRKYKLATKPRNALMRGFVFRHPQRTVRCKPCKALLFDRFYFNWANVSATGSLNKAQASAASVFCVYDKALMYAGSSFYFDTKSVERTRPMMSRATSFHNNQRHVAIDKPSFRIGARVKRCCSITRHCVSATAS